MKKTLLSIITLLIAGANLFAQRPAFVGTTVYGGAGNGSIFFTDTTYTFVNSLYGFVGGSGGYSPESGVTMAPNNRFYGVTPGGFANSYGGIYEITAGGTYVTMYNFTGASDGSSPKAELCIANDGTLYGTTTSGGTYGYGTLFSYVPGSGTVTTLHSFDGTNGSNANRHLIQAADGLLYGVTAGGGASGYGVLFSYDIGAPLFTVLHSFNSGTEGTNPTELVEASNGKLYGLMGNNGVNGAGAVFNYDPVAPAFTINYAFANSTESYSPFCGLTEGAPGYLYGVTSGGGSNSYGNIFEFYFPTNTYTNMYNFLGTTDGASPEGGLIKSSFNNKFYGTCYSGGSNGGGTLFEFSPVGPTFTKMIDFGGAGNGQGPMRMTLTEYVPLQASISSSPALCYGSCNGSATVIPTGGTAPYFYSWSPSGGSSATATGLCANSYTCTITDMEGSVVSYLATVTEPSGITGADFGTNVSCNGGSDGTATTNPTGGTLPYTFLWDAAAGNQTTQIATGLSSGIYGVQITDANGCMVTDYHPVTEPALLTQVLTQTIIACQGASAGQAVSTPSGGTPPYSYSWSNGSTTATASGLSGQNYTCTVADANGCTDLDFTLITEQATDIWGHISTPTVPSVSAGSGNVYAFRFQPGSAGLDTFDISSINASGDYRFSGIDSGQFMIKVILDTSVYQLSVPTYYGNTFQWDSSIIVNHGCTLEDTISIQVLEIDTTQTGSGFISGYVVEGNDFGGNRSSGPGTNPNIPFAPGGPLKGVDIKLGKNPGGGIQARTMSDSTGYYEFTGLPLQGYVVYVDIPNLPMDSTHFITLDVNNNSSVQNNYFADSANIYINTNTIVGIHASQLVYENKFTVFPNPATDNLFVSFDMSKESKVNVELYNAIGQIVQSETIDHTIIGTNTHQVNIASLNLKAGVYFISVVNEGKKSTQRLVVVE